MDIPATSDNIPGTVVLRDASGSLTVNRVGIGVTPAATLDVTSGNTQYPAAVRIRNSTHASSKRAALSFGDVFSNTWIIGVDTPGNGADDFFIYAVSTNAVLMVFSAAGNAGIGTTAPNSAALLDVSSTTKGFLPPRMTTAQRDAISTPPAGLMIYNTTTNKLQVRTNTAWVDLH